MLLYLGVNTNGKHWNALPNAMCPGQAQAMNPDVFSHSMTQSQEKCSMVPRTKSKDPNGSNNIFSWNVQNLQ